MKELRLAAALRVQRDVNWQPANRLLDVRMRNDRIIIAAVSGYVKKEIEQRTYYQGRRAANRVLIAITDRMGEMKRERR